MRGTAHYVVLCCPKLRCCAILRCVASMLRNVVLRYAMLCYIALYWAMLRCVVLCCALLYYVVLRCAVAPCCTTSTII